MKTLMLLLTLSLLASCGKDGGDSDNGPGGFAIQEQQAEGEYRAILRPMNNSLSGFLPTGVAEIKIAGDAVNVKTLLDDDARVPHMQSVHIGTRCPTASADSNRDGIIDIVEAKRASGEVLIPLDADLNSLEAGMNVYPSGRGFTYLESGSLAQLENDVKSRVRQNLNLGGRVVIIHGVNNMTKMPGTVASADGLTPQASVPVACGVLKRIESN